jgi:hypothetical protein
MLVEGYHRLWVLFYYYSHDELQHWPHWTLVYITSELVDYLVYVHFYSAFEQEICETLFEPYSIVADKFGRQG